MVITRKTSSLTTKFTCGGWTETRMHTHKHTHPNTSTDMCGNDPIRYTPLLYKTAMGNTIQNQGWVGNGVIFEVHVSV